MSAIDIGLFLYSFGVYKESIDCKQLEFDSNQGCKEI